MTLRRPLVRNLGLMVLFVALAALAVGGVSALASSDTPAGWEVGAAPEKMDLSVSDSALEAGKTLTNFPVKVLLSQGNFDYTGGAQAELDRQPIERPRAIHFGRENVAHAFPCLRRDQAIVDHSCGVDHAIQRRQLCGELFVFGDIGLDDRDVRSCLRQFLNPFALGSIWSSPRQ